MNIEKNKNATDTLFERESMMKVKEHNKLDLRNLISLRRSGHASEFSVHTERLLAYIAAHGAKKIGGGVSATYAIDGDKADIEIYFPIDKEIPSTDEFIFKPRLYLENCLKISHKGDPQLLEHTMQKLNEYITSNRLTPISAGFNVTVREIMEPKDLDLFEVDVYISISPNVL